MPLQPLVEAAGLAVLATCSVGLWTLRVAVAAAGRRLIAAIIAGIESLLFALAFGTLIGSLDDPLRVAAYAVGVGLGTLVGLIADERLSTGQSLVHVVVDGDGGAATDMLRARGWPVTHTPSNGVNGVISVLMVAIDDSALRRLRRDIDDVAPQGFVTIERLRTVRPTELPADMHRVGGRRSGRRRDESEATTVQPIDDGDALGCAS